MKYCSLQFVLFIALLFPLSCNDDNTTLSPYEQSITGDTFQGDLNLRTQANIDFIGSKNLKHIDGNLNISNQLDDTVIDLTPLSSIISAKGINISGTSDLTSLKGLENIRDFEVISLSNNSELRNMDALTIPSVFNGSIFLGNCSKFDGFDHLSNLEEVNTFSLYNLEITDFSVFSNLKRVNGFFALSNFQHLTSLEGFELEYIGRRLALQDNPNLTTLNGLESLAGVGEFIETEIFLNPLLADFCGMSIFTEVPAFADNYRVFGNYYNPTPQDLIDGNCN